MDVRRPGNPYLPLPMRVERNTVETSDRGIRTLALSFLRKEDGEGFRFTPGQFTALSILGVGEAPFGIASPPETKNALEFTVSRVGAVTTELHYLEPGDPLGLRGPLGNGWPMEEMEGRNLLVIGGGFGFSTLRSMVCHVLHPGNRQRYRDIQVVYGARNPGMLLYRSDLSAWKARDDVRVLVTVDQADPEWDGETGLVPVAVRKVRTDPANTVTLLCGPPAMMQHTLPVLADLGIPPERIYLSLEMKMKCGVGKCGRCNIGSAYVCTEGPVFSLSRLQRLPKEY